MKDFEDGNDRKAHAQAQNSATIGYEPDYWNPMGRILNMRRPVVKQDCFSSVQPILKVEPEFRS